MDATIERFGTVLEDVAAVAGRIETPTDPQVRRWLLGQVQVAQIELDGLEARLAREPRINGTPQPRTPATQRPDPKPGTTSPKPPPPPPKKGR